MNYQLKHQNDDKEQVPEEKQNVYESLMQAAVLFMAEDQTAAADALVQTDRDSLELDAAKTLYDKLSGQLFAEQSDEVYEVGHDLYTAGSYEEALVEFGKSLKMNPDNVNAMYFTGRSYHRLGDTEQAKVWYNRLIEDYPDSKRATEAKERMRELE